MTLDRIRLFICVAKNRSISQAARELGISQCAASRKLQQLEVKVSSKLFERKGGGMELTASGRTFRHEVSSLWSQFEELEKRYTPSRDSLTIAASHRPSKYLLPRLMIEFSKMRPSAKLTLLTRSSVEIEKLLLESRVDLAITNNVNMSGTVSDHGVEPEF